MLAWKSTHSLFLHKWRSMIKTHEHWQIVKLIYLMLRKIDSFFLPNWILDFYISHPQAQKKTSVQICLPSKTFILNANSIRSYIDKLYNFHGKPHKLFMVQLVPMSTINYKESCSKYIGMHEMYVGNSSRKNWLR